MNYVLVTLSNEAARTLTELAQRTGRQEEEIASTLLNDALVTCGCSDVVFLDASEGDTLGIECPPRDDLLNMLPVDSPQLTSLVASSPFYPK